MVVVNPSHPLEDISERWEDVQKYEAFVSGMKQFQRQLVQSASADDMGKQSDLLQSLFGETLAKRAFEEQGRSIQKIRAAQSMGVARSATGIVSLVSSASPLPRNTFYGDR